MSSSIISDKVYAQAPDWGEDDIELGDLLEVIVQAKWLILSTTVALVLLGTVYVWLAIPIYKADGLLQVEERSTGLSRLNINELIEGDTSVNAEIELLRSRSVLGDVVDNLNLDIVAEPVFFPIVGAALARHGNSDNRPSIQVDTLDLPSHLVGAQLTLVAGQAGRYRLLGPDGELLLDGGAGQTAGVQLRGRGLLNVFVSELTAKPGDSFVLQRRSRLSAIAGLQGSLQISERGSGSGILAISLEGENPVDLSRQVNEIANIYVRKNVERKSAEAQQTLSFLEEQLPVVKQNMETAEVALNSYRLEKGSIDLPLETQTILATIVTVEGKLNELEQEHDQLTQRFTPAHPMLIALNKQIQRLAGELDRLNERTKELPHTQQEVLRLFRDVQVNTELYTSLLNTAQELRVVKAGTVGNVRVVDYAVPTYGVIKPRKASIQGLSLLLGVLLGVAGAFLRKALSGGVEDPDLIEKQIGLPVYAVISHSKQQEKLHRKMKAVRSEGCVLADRYPKDVSIESIRNLRTTLHFGMMDVKNNVIMIAGPGPTVGKSFVSVNLAATLASAGSKVLLIDGDMRRGHLHRYLGLKRENGLSEFISGGIRIGDAIRKTDIKQLDLIPAGKLPPNPAELLLHQRFINCLNVLSPHYDQVIVDSPPVLAVTDASVIGQLAGATLLVVKAGAHPMREIEQSVKRLQQAGVNLRGVLFNDVDVSSRRYGAGKYYYQYAYKH